MEDNTTAFLVRSTATGWKKSSVLAVDAGTHLAAITQILEGHSSDYSPNDEQRPVTLIDGPFAGLEIPHSSAKANAAHITRTLIDTYLITHPHLDHISGFVVNTAALPGTRPKRIAALPSTIEAFKNHIFNNVIWPNLSDENNGAGLVTYMRLVEGGSPAVGDGEGKGYVEICDGLSVKAVSVSHGHCFENHSHRGSSVTLSPTVQLDPGGNRLSQSGFSPLRTNSMSGNVQQYAADSTILIPPREKICVVDSSAYFIRDVITGIEVLIFGDVEPDAISLSPRNKLVWRDAAPKIVSGHLGGILIECSYDDSQSDDTLFGHLAPRFLIDELKVLASEVYACKNQKLRIKESSKKRKRLSNANGNGNNNGHSDTWDFGSPRRRSTRATISQTSSISPRTIIKPRSSTIENEVSNLDTIDGNIDHDDLDEATLEDRIGIPIRPADAFPLKGLKVVIIHAKDKLMDGHNVGEVILSQLLEYEESARLGCEFVLSRKGQALFL